MGEKHLFVNAIIIKALFFFLACFITTKINAQSINFITTQNALPQLDERIVKAGNSFQMQILNQKLVSGKRYKLSLTIKGRGIELKSSPEWYPKPIDLNGEPILNLTSYDLAPYFDIENLDFTGYSKEDYVLQGGVPDGSYNVCFQLYDNTSDAFAAVGNKACVVMWAKKEDVPKITNPTRNPTIDQSIPYNFTWIPRHTSGGLIAYDFEIYEENTSMSYNDIMLYNSPVLKTTTSTTSYLLNANNNILKRGRKYFCIVKANATLGGTVFKNGGYSEPEYFSYGVEKGSRDAENSCPLPDGQVFINEISQGCSVEAGYVSTEYIELVVVGQGSEDFVNLEGYIIDDNNHEGVEIGNEPGHIRLGSCFNAVPSGTIILLYNDGDINPLINPSNNNTNGSPGFWQVPFRSSCLIKYEGCPDNEGNENYGCSAGPNVGYWNNYIPMRNERDVLQIRTPSFSQVHTVAWLTTNYEYIASPKTVHFQTLSGNSAYGKTFILSTGTDWNVKSNWAVTDGCLGGNQSSPGLPNSQDNTNLINGIKNGFFSNDFYISCAPLAIPFTSAKVDITGSAPGNHFSISVDGVYRTTTTLSSYTISNLSIGNHSILVIEDETGCQAICNIEILCQSGLPCNDFDDCTTNDMTNQNCECIGEQLLPVTFDTTMVAGDTLCNYCIDFDTCTFSYIIHNIIFKLPNNQLITLDNTTNFLGFNFPYCVKSAVSNSACNGLLDQFELVSDLQHYLDQNQLKGEVSYNHNSQCFIKLGSSPLVCYNHIVVENSLIAFVSMNYQRKAAGSDLVNFNWPFTKLECHQDFTKYYVTPSVACDSIISYAWSTGQTTNGILLDSIIGCYGVTITCLNGCEYTGSFGENCEECIMGNPCDDNDPCTAADTYDVDCNCVGVAVTDSDNDGNCDPIDLCPGEDDFLDFDMDGIPDCLDTIITCDQFEATLQIDTLLPGTCNYSINFDSLRGESSFINISKILVSQGGSNIEITEGLPLCYSNFGFPPLPVFNDNFENNQWGNWNGYPEDAKVVKQNVLSGEYALRVRDNNDFSSITSNPIYIGGYASVFMTFDVKAKGFTDSSQKFILEVSFDNGVTYTKIREWTYNTDFVNDQINGFGGSISTNEENVAQLRIRTDYEDFGGKTNFDDAELFFDNIVVSKLVGTCSSSPQNVANVITDWINNPANNATGTVSVVTTNPSNPCSKPGKKIQIIGSNYNFDGIVFNTLTNGSQSAFCAWDCIGSITGDTSYIARINTNCPDPIITWSDGSLADSLLLMSLNGQMNVTVACNDCDTTITFGNQLCQVGGFCTDSNLCIYGYFDENCVCIGDTITDDFDLDGIYDCIDPCLGCGLNDSNGNGICDCDECPQMDSLTFNYTDATATICDYCFDIEGLNSSNLLTAVTLTDNNGNKHYLQDTSNFSFPYCYETFSYSCDIDGIEYNSIKQFISDFYYWYSKYDKEFRFVIERDSTCDPTSSLTLKLEGSKFNNMVFFFGNTEVHGTPFNCRQDITGYYISIDSIPPCDSLTYLWSNGSTNDTVYTPVLSSGYSVTLTCTDGCVYKDSIDNVNCYIGKECDDYNDCTENDIYNEYCVCTGEFIPGCGVNPPDTCDLAIEVCTYCVNLPREGDCILAGGLEFYNNAGQLDTAILSFAWIGGNCLVATNNFVTQVQTWLTQNNYLGTVSYSERTCSGSTPGYSITITNTNIDLLGLLIKNETPRLFETLECKTINVPEPCDDGNVCTVNDYMDANCNCVGIFVDTDGDTVCDELDQCEGQPDYMDNNHNGVPDGCEVVKFFCNADTIPFCEYLKKFSAASCANKMQPINLIALQDTLKMYLVDSAWQLPNFNIPELILNLQMQGVDGDGDGKPDFDQDEDGILDFFDPCPKFFNKAGPEGLFSITNFPPDYVSDFYSCCDGNMSSVKASMLAYLLFNAGTDILQKGSTVLYSPECATGLTDVGGFWYLDSCKVNITVDCNCNCGTSIANDADNDDICDQIDNHFGVECDTVCPLDLDRCKICAVVANPLYDAFDPSSGPPCYLQITDIIDTDHDSICDLYDLCPGTAADSTETGGPLPEFDDGIDVNGNGIPACLDPCDAFNLSGYQREGYETPVGIGDVCDDGDPCTYADSISYDCQCQGITVDIDNDSVFDCSECKIYQKIGGVYVEVSKYGPFEANGEFIITGGDAGDGAVKCDVCPDLDDTADYNDNGVPDCLDPPYYPIGCPDSMFILPEQGLVLTFDSEEIKLEDLPQPVELTFVSGGASFDYSVYNYEYLNITSVREVNGKFEVLYALEGIINAADYSYLGVNYGDHQNCINGNPNDVIDAPCPSSFTIENGKIVLVIDYGSTENQDISKLFTEFQINGTYGVNGIIDGSYSVGSGADVVAQANGTTYEVTLNIENVHPDSNVVINSITLSNGTTCTYSGGEIQIPAECAPIIPGSPCDDGLVCTHHDRYVFNGTTCICQGDEKPDKDFDGICDEIDPCPDDTNIDNNGDGILDCPCPNLVINGSELVSGNDFSLDLNPDGLDQLTSFTITISGGPDGDITQNTGTTMPLVVANLPKGYPLTITITGNGANGCSTSTTQEIDVPFDTDPAFCGFSLSDEVYTNGSGLQTLVNGDVFKAYDFNVKVSKATGHAGVFSGKGYIEIPYFNLVRVNVKFKNIYLNNDYKLMSGFVEIVGLGQNILGDNIIEYIDNVLPILQDLSDLIENVSDIVENIEELIETTGDMVDPSIVDCIRNATKALEDLSKDPNATQQQLNDAKAELDRCKTLYNDALGAILEDFYIVLMGSDDLGLDGIVKELSNCNLVDEENAYMEAKADYIDLIDDGPSVFEDILDQQNGQGFTGFSTNGTKESSYLSPTNLYNDQQLTPLANDFYTKQADYLVCYSLGRMESEIENIAGAKNWLVLLLEAGNDFMPVVQNSLKDPLNEDPNPAIRYQNVIDDTKDEFKQFLKELLIHKSYEK